MLSRPRFSGLASTLLALGAIACSDGGLSDFPPTPHDAGADTIQPDAGDPNNPDAEVETGGVFGTAQFFGREDHAGITLCVEGTDVQATTSADGSFSLDAVPLGNVVVTATRPPYQPSSIEVVVERNQQADAGDIVLRLGELLHEGEDCIPLGFTPTGEHALYFTDFSPYVGTGSLWSHEVGGDTELHAGTGASPVAVIASPDGSKLALLRDLSVSTGIGSVVALDLTTRVVKELADEGSVDTLWFTDDSAYLVFMTGVDLVDQTGSLHVVSTDDWTDHELANDVAVYSVERPTSGTTLWFSANLSMSTSTADLYRYELGDAEAELVDTQVLPFPRWLGGDGQPVLYLTAPALGYSGGTLKAWSAGTATTLASDVPADMVFVDGEESVVFLSNGDELAGTGTLSRWEVGGGQPTQIAPDVQVGAMRTHDGSKLVYTHDPDPTTQQGSLAVWDFDEDASHDLGAGAGPWVASEDGSRIAYFVDFDVDTQLGALHVFDASSAQSALVEQEASTNVLELDSSGAWLAYQRNPIGDTFMGDLWLYDVAADESSLLAAAAMPVVRWSDGSTLMAYFTDPDASFETALGYVRAPSTGQTAQLGRISFAYDHLRFSPGGQEVTFLRNPSTDATSGDLWVWDATKDPWTGTDPGVPVLSNVVAWSVGFFVDGLLLTSDVSANWDSSTLTWWSRQTRALTVLGNGILPDSAIVSTDGSRVVYFGNVASYPRVDMYVADLSNPQPTLLSEKVHVDSLWMDEQLTRASYVAGGSGDLGDLTMANLAEGTARTIASDAPYFGIRISPDGARMSFSHDWDTSRSLGTLSTIDTVTPDAAYVPVDDEAPLTHMVSDGHVVYVVQSTESERSGVYLAPAL